MVTVNWNGRQHLSSLLPSLQALQCKEILRTREAVHRKAADFVLARFRQMVAAITGEHFAKWHGLGGELPARRMALLAGFPRSGTTLLEQVPIRR